MRNQGHTPRVIHTAQALVDEVVEVAALPSRGNNAMADSYARYAGGAVTILLAAARSGASCVHAGAVGTGANGDLIRAVLAAEQIAVSAPPVPDRDTGICFVMIEPSGERTFVTTRGAERKITPESLTTSVPTTGDLVCVSGYSLLDPTREPLQEWLKTLSDDVIVVLDPGAVFADLPAGVRQEMLARTSVWTSNADEAMALTGAPDYRAAARALPGVLPTGAVVIVRDGPNGCVLSVPEESSEPLEIPGFPQTPIDTNGAGDTHTGVLCASRAAGLSWKESATRANAAGAIKVTRKGPDTAPTAAEIDDFLSRVR